MVWAHEVVADETPELLDLLAKKFMDLDEYPRRQPGDQRVTVRVNVDRVGGAGPWVEAR